MSVGFLFDSVLKVVMMPQLSELPEAPPWAPGVLNLRGSSVPVVDVLARLTHSRRQPNVLDFVVVCRVEERLCGFVVQQVLELDALRSDQAEAPGDGLTVAPYLVGVVHQGAEALLLLDVVSLVASSDLPALAD
jgi:purine-binding chemotaxis protein CheW